MAEVMGHLFLRSIFQCPRASNACQITVNHLVPVIVVRWAVDIDCSVGLTSLGNIHQSSKFLAARVGDLAPSVQKDAD